MRVLLADGDEMFLEVVQRYLERHGHEVKIAATGVDAVASLREYLPDVVVLDRGLLWGGSDGVRALMLQDHLWSEIPVILTSDNLLAEQSHSNASPPWGAELKKPYRLPELLVHLEACSRPNTFVEIELFENKELSVKDREITGPLGL